MGNAEISGFFSLLAWYRRTVNPLAKIQKGNSATPVAVSLSYVLAGSLHRRKLLFTLKIKIHAPSHRFSPGPNPQGFGIGRSKHPLDSNSCALCLLFTFFFLFCSRFLA